MLIFQASRDRRPRNWGGESDIRKEPATKPVEEDVSGAAVVLGAAGAESDGMEADGSMVDVADGAEAEGSAGVSTGAAAGVGAGAGATAGVAAEAGAALGCSSRSTDQHDRLSSI